MFCHIYPVLEEGLFFLAHLKTRLELNYPPKEKAALESWNLVGSERRFPLKYSDEWFKLKAMFLKDQVLTTQSRSFFPSILRMRCSSVQAVQVKRKLSV